MYFVALNIVVFSGPFPNLTDEDVSFNVRLHWFKSRSIAKIRRILIQSDAEKQDRAFGTRTGLL